MRVCLVLTDHAGVGLEGLATKGWKKARMRSRNTLSTRKNSSTGPHAAAKRVHQFAQGRSFRKETHRPVQTGGCRLMLHRREPCRNEVRCGEGRLGSLNPQCSVRWAVCQRSGECSQKDKKAETALPTQAQRLGARELTAAPGARLGKRRPLRAD